MLHRWWRVGGVARMGIDTVVLEKHADFVRDFRGDTIHASTLEIMYELGILKQFLRRPHQEVRQLAGQIGSETVVIADFTHLPTRCKFVALMPQWDFLDFVKEQASIYETFHLNTQAEVCDLIFDKDLVKGVRARHAGSPGASHHRSGRPPFCGSSPGKSGDTGPRRAKWT